MKEEGKFVRLFVKIIPCKRMPHLFDSPANDSLRGSKLFLEKVYKWLILSKSQPNQSEDLPSSNSIVNHALLRRFPIYNRVVTDPRHPVSLSTLVSTTLNVENRERRDSFLDESSPRKKERSRFYLISSVGENFLLSSLDVSRVFSFPPPFLSNERQKQDPQKDVSCEEGREGGWSRNELATFN